MESFCSAYKSSYVSRCRILGTFYVVKMYRIAYFMHYLHSGQQHKTFQQLQQTIHQTTQMLSNVEQSLQTFNMLNQITQQINQSQQQIQQLQGQL